MSLANPEPWEGQGDKKVIISDGMPGIGLAALRVAKDRGLLTGGFVCGGHTAWYAQYGLRTVTDLTQAQRMNILKSDAVLIVAEDPRMRTVDTLINLAKERHRKTALVLQPNHMHHLAGWLTPRERIVYLTGIGEYAFGEAITRNFITLWDTEVKTP